MTNTTSAGVLPTAWSPSFEVGYLRTCLPTRLDVNRQYLGLACGGAVRIQNSPRDLHLLGATSK